MCSALWMKAPWALYPTAVAAAPLPESPIFPATRSRRSRLLQRIALGLALGFLVFAVVVILAIYESQPVATSIQVYDIENATKDPAYNYLCKGTSNELIRRLTRLAGLSVTPMHSVQTASRPSTARYQLEGMLQDHGGQIRLSVLLTDNQEHRAIDSEDFDRARIDDPLQLQSDIASSVVLALERHRLQPRAWEPVLCAVRSCPSSPPSARRSAV